MAQVPAISVPANGQAVRAFCANASEYVVSFPGVPSGAQSSKGCPSPLMCGGAQAAPQQRERLHSQPLALLPSQVAYPVLHVMPQVLPLHEPEALAALGQTFPHMPQLAASVVTLASQPSVPDRLQSRKFAPHAVQLLLEQYCDVVHDMLQAPQLVPLVVVLISHPLPVFPSQSACPRGHASTQLPETQSLPMAHGILQPPQCKFDVAVLVSQPLVLLPSQLPKFASHAPSVHVPVEHDSLALAKLHVTPQPPQFAKVLSAVSQPLFTLLSQFANPIAQDGVQLPAEHVVVPLGLVHVVPQVPQLETVVNGVSQPLAMTASQSPKFALHDVRAHVPVWHVPVPFAYEQTTPHIPQFEIDAFVFVSQPLFGFESQLANPTAHEGVHVPLMHVVVPFMLVHVVPQDPQFDVLVPVLTSQPFPYIPSQFWNGAVHD